MNGKKPGSDSSPPNQQSVQPVAVSQESGEHVASSEDSLETVPTEASPPLSSGGDSTAESAQPSDEQSKPWSKWQIVGMVLAVKAVIIWFGATSYQLHLNERVQGWHGWIAIWNRWDAARHLRLEDGGYTNIGEFRGDLVGFPLYPWIVRYLSYIFQDTQVTAFIVSGIASIAAALLLYKLSRLDQRERVARNAVWFLLIFPTSHFLHINYNESLFIALTLGSFLAARQRNWKIAGVLGFLTCMTRLNGLVLIPALAVEAFQEYRETKKLRWEWLFIPLISGGLGVYMILNWFVAGNPWEFLAIGRDHFQKSLSPPWSGIIGTYNLASQGSPSMAIITGTQELNFIILGFICTVFCIRYLRLSYSVWMVGNWLLVTSVGFILSVPRYTLAMFPIFILFGKLAERRTWYTIITVWSLLLLSLFISQFVRGHWTF